MARTSRYLVACACMLAWVSTAAALYIESKTEEFGPAPSDKAASDRRYALRHAAGRVSWLHTSWNGWGQDHNEGRVACQGSMDAVNEAIRDFAALPSSSKEIWLFPGPGVVRSLDEKITRACDWQIRWMSHISYPRGDRKNTTEVHEAVMTVFVTHTAPIPKLDPRAAEWIKELDDERFAVRQRAFQALSEQREAILPLVRQALEQNPPQEKRKRLEQLAARLQEIHAASLQLPKGMVVRSLDELLEQQRQNWRSGNLPRSWEAAEKISAWAEYSADALPLLVEMLQDDRELVRDRAVAAFKRLGRRAESSLPALRLLVERTPAARAAWSRNALQAIEQAPEDPGIEKAWRHNQVLRKDLAAFCRARG